MATTVAIIDLGSGNLLSVYRKVVALQANAFVTTNLHDITKADKVILPGVGNFEKASLQLKTLKIEELLNELVLIKQKPILGICLGMQLMADESEEGKTKGLGWIRTKVVKFNVQNKIRYKVPQVGWNTVDPNKSSILLKGIAQESEFYFLHSYHYKDAGCARVVAETEYESRFVSLVEKDNIFGTQFHPEKSHQAGTQLLKNFILL